MNAKLFLGLSIILLFIACSTEVISEYASPYKDVPIVSNCNGMLGNTVKIGTQTWMKENLNCNISGSKCYGNIQTNCDKYGRLYDWSTAMALPSRCNSDNCTSQMQSPHRGICPEGWHIPSNADWDTLYRYADSTSDTSSPYKSPTAGRYLKATSGWNHNTGTDLYGFSALPGGYDYYGYNDVGNIGYWWSSDEYGGNNAYSRYMQYDDVGAFWSSKDRSYLFSVRCIKD